VAWFNWQAPGEKPFAPNTGFYPPTGSDLLNISDVVAGFLSRLSSGKPAYMMSGQNLQNYKASGAKSMDEYRKLVSEGKAIPPGGDSVIEPSAPAPAPEPSGLDLARPKPFAMTPEGQFDRYFKTPEFDYVFGAGSRGKGAPADAAAMEVLGNQLMAPEKDTNVASMYAAQSAMGRVNQAAIQEMYKDRPDLQKWAAANPMLAQREFLKSEQRRASEMPTAPDQETVMGDLGSRAQDEGGYSLEAYGVGEPKEGEEIIDAVNFLKKKAGLQK